MLWSHWSKRRQEETVIAVRRLTSKTLNTRTVETDGHERFGAILLKHPKCYAREKPNCLSF